MTYLFFLVCFCCSGLLQDHDDAIALHVIEAPGDATISGCALAEDGSWCALAIEQQDQILIIDTETYQVLHELQTPSPRGMAVLGNHLLAGNFEAGTVTAIATEDWTVTEAVDLSGVNPYYIAVAPGRAGREFLVVVRDPSRYSQLDILRVDTARWNAASVLAEGQQMNDVSTVAIHPAGRHFLVQAGFNSSPPTRIFGAWELRPGAITNRNRNQRGWPRGWMPLLSASGRGSTWVGGHQLFLGDPLRLVQSFDGFVIRDLKSSGFFVLNDHTVRQFSVRGEQSAVLRGWRQLQDTPEELGRARLAPETMQSLKIPNGKLRDRYGPFPLPVGVSQSGDDVILMPAPDRRSAVLLRVDRYNTGPAPTPPAIGAPERYDFDELGFQIETEAQIVDLTVPEQCVTAALRFDFPQQRYRGWSGSLVIHSVGFDATEPTSVREVRQHFQEIRNELRKGGAAVQYKDRTMEPEPDQSFPARAFTRKPARGEGEFTHAVSVLCGRTHYYLTLHGPDAEMPDALNAMVASLQPRLITGGPWKNYRRKDFAVALPLQPRSNSWVDEDGRFLTLTCGDPLQSGQFAVVQSKDSEPYDVEEMFTAVEQELTEGRVEQVESRERLKVDGFPAIDLRIVSGQGGQKQYVAARVIVAGDTSYQFLVSRFGQPVEPERMQRFLGSISLK